MGSEKQLQRMRRSTDLSLHTLHVLHDKFDTRHAFLERYDGLTLLSSGRKRIAPGPSPSPEQDCTAPWRLSASRMALPAPTLRSSP